MSRVQIVKARRQKRGYQERTREVQFRRGDWVWRSYPQLKPGKLQNKNVGPWLVLGPAREVTYKIQQSKKNTVQVVHVDKLARYYPEKSSQTEPITRTSGADVFEDGGEVGTEPLPQAEVQVPVPTDIEVQPAREQREQITSPSGSRRSKRVRVPPRYRRLAMHTPTLSSLCPLKYYYSATRGCQRKLKIG